MNMKIDSLIERMTPLYNSYKKNGRKMKAREAIKLMWAIGNMINEFVTVNKIAPHKLYRLIYGMSEGKTNTIRNSWITREFQGRCLRIYKIFREKNEIDQFLPNLSRFTLFREAMPFFDNTKYKLSGQDRDRLLKILNSNATDKNILTEIRKMQKAIIGIRNDRNQRLADLSEEKVNFIKFYNYIFDLLKKSKKDQKVALIKNGITLDHINALVINTSALTNDGLATVSLPKAEPIEIIWKDYLKLVDFFGNQKDPKKIRRFRRIVPPARIFRLAEMLYELTKVL